MNKPLTIDDFNKIKNFINTMKHEGIVDLLFKQTSDGKYIIANYTLHKNNKDQWIVSHDGVTTTFFYKKTATYYIIANLLGLKEDVLSIINVDNKIAKAQHEIEVLNQVLNHLMQSSHSADTEWDIGLYHNKLTEQVARLAHAKELLSKWELKLTNMKYYAA